MVNPNGGAVSDCHFEYGSTSAYGSSVPCASLPGSGTAAVAVSAEVEGLAPNSTYHFRIVASNEGGSGTGSDQGLTTLPNAPRVKTAAASSLMPTSPSLHGTVSPAGAAVSDSFPARRSSDLYGSSVPCASLPGSGTAAVAVSAEVEGLAPNSTYHFRIVASNEGGRGSGSDQGLTTLPNAPSVKTAAASGIKQTSATLNGTINPNGGAVSDCHFEYGSTSSYGSSAPCATLLGSGSRAVAVSAEAKGLAPNTTYHFRSVASDESGTSSGTHQTLRTRPNPPSVVPSAAKVLAPPAVMLNASVNPEGGAVSDCHLEYGTTVFYEASVPCASLPGSGTAAVAVSAEVKSLVPNTT